MQRTAHPAGVPMDLGQSLRGVDVGPWHRATGRTCPMPGETAIPRTEQRKHRNARTQHVTLSRRVVLYTSRTNHLRTPVRQRCGSHIPRGACPWDMEGAIIQLPSARQAVLRITSGLGLFWIDAHADCNTPGSTPSGNVHGMPLAVLTGHGYYHTR